MVLDEETSNSLSFKCRQVKIATKTMKFINTVAQVKCRDNFYPVRICEEQVMLTKVTESCNHVVHLRREELYSSTEVYEHNLDNGDS